MIICFNCRILWWDVSKVLPWFLQVLYLRRFQWGKRTLSHNGVPIFSLGPRKLTLFVVYSSQALLECSTSSTGLIIWLRRTNHHQRNKQKKTNFAWNQRKNKWINNMSEISNLSGKEIYNICAVRFANFSSTWLIKSKKN